MKLIELTTSDSKQKFYLNPEDISAMTRNDKFTMVFYKSLNMGAWPVLETPGQIAQLAEIEIVKQTIRQLKPGPHKFCVEHDQAPPCTECDYEDVPMFKK